MASRDKINARDSGNGINILRLEVAYVWPQYQIV